MTAERSCASDNLWEFKCHPKTATARIQITFSTGALQHKLAFPLLPSSSCCPALHPLATEARQRQHTDAHISWRTSPREPRIGQEKRRATSLTSVQLRMVESAGLYSTIGPLVPNTGPRFRWKFSWLAFAAHELHSSFKTRLLRASSVENLVEHNTWNFRSRHCFVACISIISYEGARRQEKKNDVINWKETFFSASFPFSSMELYSQLRALTAATRSSCFVSISRSRMRTAMALWVRLSSLASFLATSRFRSQSGFLGARLTRSYH